VVEGSRTLTINGTNAAEIHPSASSNLVAVGKLGRTSSRSQSDSLKIKECRILYKKAEQVDPQKQLDFAEQAMWTPAPYVDPNALDRKLAKGKLIAPNPDGRPGDAKTAKLEGAPGEVPRPKTDASLLEAFGGPDRKPLNP
jgi:hypothetical protein